MNKYLEKIAEKSNREAEAASVAGKAVLSDKVGDLAGAGLGGYIAHKLGASKATGALVGAGLLGTGLTYASIRNDYLNKHAGIFNFTKVQTPVTSETATRTIGIRG